MTSLFRATLLGFALLLAAEGPASASISIAFVPVSQTVPLFSNPSVNLVVSGLGGSTSPALGGFEFNVFYDPAILLATGTSFGLKLGDEGAGEALTFADTSVPGTATFTEISLLPSSSLFALQPTSFVLGTLQFQAIGLGTSPLSFDSIVLSDESGNVLASGSGTGSISVTATPEPRLQLLLSACFVGLVSLRRLRARRAE